MRGCIEVRGSVGMRGQPSPPKPPWCEVIATVVASNWMTWKEWSKGRVSGKEYALVSLALTLVLTLVLSLCLFQLLYRDQI